MFEQWLCYIWSELSVSLCHVHIASQRFACLKKRLIKTHSFDLFPWIPIVFLLTSAQFNYLQFPTSGRHINAIFNFFIVCLQGVWVWCRCEVSRTILTLISVLGSDKVYIDNFSIHGIFSPLFNRRDQKILLQYHIFAFISFLIFKDSSYFPIHNSFLCTHRYLWELFSR